MRARQTRYSVPGWGDGELWTCGGVVLAHDFRFDVDAGDAAGAVRADAGAARSARPVSTWPISARPPKGAHGPPTGTVPANSAQMGNGFVPDAEHSSDSSAVDAEELTARFAAFLAGTEVDFADVRLDLAESTPFQLAVAAALRAVPRGEVVSYGELAALAGHPGAARAVGTFCAGNRFMLLVPCHRVVGAAGIGGYGSAGVGVKRRLLALESVVL